MLPSEGLHGAHHGLWAPSATADSSDSPSASKSGPLAPSSSGPGPSLPSMAEPEFTKALAVRLWGDDVLVVFKWLANFNPSELRPRHRIARSMSRGLQR